MLENNIKNIIKILEESEIDEIEISTFWGKQKIRVRKNAITNSEENIKSIQSEIDPPIVFKERQTRDSKIGIQSEIVEDNLVEKMLKNPDQKDTITITAPLVGTFYKSPKPGATPFISRGDNIKKGQIICIIEAMKIFNEIESEFTGKILEILINDGTPVEYEQDLIIIVPE